MALTPEQRNVHIAALEADAESLDDGDRARLVALGTRKTVQDRLVKPVAPAIIRPREAMKASDRLAIGLENYQGGGKVAVFYGWVNPDGTAREGNSHALETASVDRLITQFGGMERLTAALRHMEQEPEFLMGPDYGDPQANLAAMILAMNAAKGRTPQRTDTHVDELYGVCKDEKINASLLAGKHILGYRLILMDAAQNPKPYHHDDVTKGWAGRLAARQAFLKDKPITGTDCLAYADLMAQRLAGQEPSDASAITPWTYTLFDADQLCSPSQVPDGYFNDGGQPDFGVYDPQYIREDGRFRSVLKGDVLK